MTYDYLYFRDKKIEDLLLSSINLFSLVVFFSQENAADFILNIWGTCEHVYFLEHSGFDVTAYTHCTYVSEKLRL